MSSFSRWLMLTMVLTIAIGSWQHVEKQRAFNQIYQENPEHMLHTQMQYQADFVSFTLLYVPTQTARVELLSVSRLMDHRWRVIVGVKNLSALRAVSTKDFPETSVEAEVFRLLRPRLSLSPPPSELANWQASIRRIQEM